MVQFIRSFSLRNGPWREIQSAQKEVQDILTRLDNLRDEVEQQEGDAQEQEIALRRLRADHLD